MNEVWAGPANRRGTFSERVRGACSVGLVCGAMKTPMPSLIHADKADNNKLNELKFGVSNRGLRFALIRGDCS